MNDHETHQFLDGVIGERHGHPTETQILAIIALELHRIQNRLHHLADIVGAPNGAA